MYVWEPPLMEVDVLLIPTNDTAYVAVSLLFLLEPRKNLKTVVKDVVLESIQRHCWQLHWYPGHQHPQDGQREIISWFLHIWEVFDFISIDKQLAPKHRQYINLHGRYQQAQNIGVGRMINVIAPYETLCRSRANWFEHWRQHEHSEWPPTNG